MNLDERIEKNTLTDLDKRMLKRHSKAKDFRRWEKVILVEDAITAAKEYAEDRCKKQRKIEPLALALLQGLMLRWKEDGYTDEGAINEAYSLANRFATEEGGE